MTKVKCTVDTCEFWGEDQVCTADQIWVRNDISGDPADFRNHFINASMTEFGEEISNEKESREPAHNQSTARTSPQTCCDTMRPKRQTSSDCDCGCE